MSNPIWPSGAASFAAAREVFHLLDHVLDMWERNREAIQELAFTGGFQEEQEMHVVIERLKGELDDLCTMAEKASSSSQLSGNVDGIDELEVSGATLQPYPNCVKDVQVFDCWPCHALFAYARNLSQRPVSAARIKGLLVKAFLSMIDLKGTGGGGLRGGGGEHKGW